MDGDLPSGTLSDMRWCIVPRNRHACRPKSAAWDRVEVVIAVQAAFSERVAFAERVSIVFEGFCSR